MAATLATERHVLALLGDAAHPLLGRAHCCFRTARHFVFVMPFLPGGTLALTLTLTLTLTLALALTLTLTLTLGELRGRGGATAAGAPEAPTLAAAAAATRGYCRRSDARTRPLAPLGAAPAQLAHGCGRRAGPQAA